jgi:glycosyltransferase involved in cell wall biosynthesis
MVNVDIYHNILWSNYKAVVFSELYLISVDKININFYQIAEYEENKVLLSKVDYSFHEYPYKLLFKGGLYSIPKYKLIKKLVLNIIKSKSELIILPGYHSIEYWFMLLFGLLLRKKIGVFCDSTKNDRRFNIIKWLFKSIFFNLCSVIFCYGDRSKNYIESFKVNKTKIVNRCQTAALPKNYSIKKIQEQRKLLKDDNFNFLFVGRLAVEKNLIFLIDSIKILTNKNKNFHLKIVGSGPLQNELIKHVNKLNLEYFISFEGSKTHSELMGIYLTSDCLVLPSLSEPWGLVANEALSYGCPLILSDKCGCVPELLQDNNLVGYKFNPNDVNDLVDKMTKAIHFFKRNEELVNYCLERIKPYTPKSASMSMFDGILKTLKNNINE